MRKFKILKINPTTGTIEVSGNVVNAFQGKFYRQPETGDVAPFYTSPVPTGLVLIKATTFDIVGNAKYTGRYTVYTPTGSGDIASSSFANSRTTIKVNENIPSLEANEASTLSTDGFITNLSTYLIDTGSTPIVVPPAVEITKYPVDFTGRDSSGWGETFLQNVVDVARNFSASAAPANPFLGMTWYNVDDQQLRVWNGSAWELINRQSYGTTYRHTQTAPAKTWTVNHGLNFPSPYIGFCQFFVDRGNGPKIIIPSDVTFDNANRLTVNFSNNEIGYVLVRQ
ncbi:hypothetical protein [Acinetobacter sp.]|uniref:hypothetical protein n=1 Tax=Acinetobacter sp. TaxID=472 RepID=UPI003890D0A4